MKLKIVAKCSDMFSAHLTDYDEKQKGEIYDGYVPAWFPNPAEVIDHCGDYVMLDIDVATGRILNWKRPTSDMLAETFKFKRGVKVGKVKI